MESPFKPKVGQLVSWGNIEIDNPSSRLGIITEIIAYDYVEVSFIQNNWVLRLNIKSLILLNDVDD